MISFSMSFCRGAYGVRRVLAALLSHNAKRRGLAALHTLRDKVGYSAVNYLFAAHKFCVNRIFLTLFA
jgi:hypothetical protein